MSKVLKAAAILVVAAIVLTIVERWYNIFYLGQLYDSVGLGFAVIGWAAPVAALIGGIYGILMIVRA